MKAAYAPRTFDYTYRKTIEVDVLTSIYDISLETPVSMAAGAGAKARSTFAPKPKVTKLAELRNWIIISLSLHTDRKDDFPKIGILYRGRVILPSFEHPLHKEPLSCHGFPDLPCWLTSEAYVFNFEDGTPLSGPGALLIRWGDFERTVPLDFDYIW